MAAPDPNNPRYLLTIREVAKELRVSKNTVYAEVKRGKLRVIHAGARITRVMRADLDAYLAAHASRPPQRPRPA
jgi:excisionase family DNA binding protein